MPVRMHHIVIDAHDLPALAGFWAEALGWTVLSTREREVVVGPSVDAPIGLCFMPAGATMKTVKNRVHLDLTTTADDRDDEIERLLGLGARRVDRIEPDGRGVFGTFLPEPRRRRGSRVVGSKATALDLTDSCPSVAAAACPGMVGALRGAA